MFGYFSHDSSLSFRFLLLVRAAPIVPFLYKPYRIRSYFQKLQHDGLVGSRSFPPIPQATNTDSTNSQCPPPHHPLFGHLLVTKRILSNLPRDAHAHYLPSQIHLQYPSLGPAYYLDM